MDAKRLFDAHTYFCNLCKSNRLTEQYGFHPCTVSGIGSLQEPLQQFRQKTAFLAVDDTNDAAIVQQAGGFFKKRTFTVFLLMRYRMDDMADRQTKLDICRNIFLQLISRMIIDKEDLSNELVYLNTARIMSRELGTYFMSGCTGLYFMTDVLEPVDVSYNEEEWK
ncbi:MAG: hypothetical protein IKJ42_07325 [Bacteroidaceae bacterium]|nr:hypothetical protein [Bacteroidaceae bacterium]